MASRIRVEMAITPLPVQAPVPGATVTPAVPQLTLHPGTVISALVVQLLENGLAQIAIDGVAIAALSEIPLQAGATLQLAVSQAAGGVIKLSVVPTPANGAPIAAPNDGTGARSAPAASATSATPLGAGSAISNLRPPGVGASPPLVDAEAIVVALATQAAAPRQQSLAPLFANLPVIVGSDAVPPAVQAGASQLLALRPELNEQLSAADLRDAFNRSGLFLESSLAAGVAPDPSSDLKAALVVFRGVLSSWLGGEGEINPTSIAQTPLPAQASVPVAQPEASQTRSAVVTAIAAELPIDPELILQPSIPGAAAEAAAAEALGV